MSDNKREYANGIRLAIKAATRQAQDNPANIHIPTAGQRGAVVGILNKITGGDDNRKLLLGWMFSGEGELFNKLSTKTLSDAQWAALYAWCEFEKDEESQIWKPKEGFANEVLAVLSACLDDYFNIRDTGDLPQPPDIVAGIINYTGGEITSTGSKGAGIKGAPDEVFSHEKDLPDISTPDFPYKKVKAGERIEPALKRPFEKKVKLINPFQ